MTNSKNYNPQEIESKWYAHWMQKDYFSSQPDEREAFSIVIPPPNVTRVLHMGHMLNNTIQDILIRRARMQGKNACWVPGTDHAAIATEAKVVQLLREQGIKKSDIGREEFLKHAFDWEEKYGGIILKQLERLGASCDWKRTKFTMDPAMSDAVLDSFIHLHKKGFLYRDKKMVNWDPAAKTTLSNEEVIYKEEPAELLYIKYKIKDSEEYLPVATVRPETIMGDVAVAVHPKDERYKHLVGKTVIVPMIHREVPVVTDEGVELEFGTGALKVTPAHDGFDYEIGKKYNLEVIDCFEEDGIISPAAQIFVGMDRFEARKAATQRLHDDGLIIKSEEIVHKVGTSERSGAVVEPRLSVQWFVKMQELVKPALENVANNNIQFMPDRFKNLYNHWLENCRDWPISRQLWWGQQIPAFYNADGDIAVCKSLAEAEALFSSRNQSLENIHRDEDVLDTWFSSWLWPISVFDPTAIAKGFENANQDLKYYYPTSVLVTGWDIIFFWVARMIFAGYEFAQEKPFSKVYFTGMVRDKQRRKMSKSLGNSPDALELIDRFGADGLRFGILTAGAAGNDILYDDKLCEQGRNFSNKLWNATKLIKMWQVEDNQDADLFPCIWMQEKIKQCSVQLHTMIENLQLSEALKMLYAVIWDDFCSSYLEWIKPGFEKPISRQVLDKTIDLYDQILALLHPFMPFITEELYHQLRERETDLIVAAYPDHSSFDSSIVQLGETCIAIISNIRDMKARNEIKPKDEVELYISTTQPEHFAPILKIIERIGFVKTTTFSDTEDPKALSFVVDNIKMSILGDKEINLEDQAQKLQTELDYIIGFKESVMKKLSNEKFVSSAPEKVIAIENQKLADAIEKIKLLEDSLQKIRG